MSWEKVKLEQFLKNRKGRYKPNDKAILGLKRIDKIDFAGNIYLSEKPSNTDMILVKKGDLVISGINVEKGAMNIYLGEDDVVATIHYSSYEFDENNIDIEFLKWFLKSIEFKNALKEQVPGGIKTEIKPKHILPLEVFIPIDIEEQKSIVKNLNRNNNSVNNVSSELTNQLNLIKQLRQSFLREAIQGKLVSNDTKDGKTGAELLAEIQTEKENLIKEKKIKKSKPLPPISEEEIPFEIPENWVWCRLGEILTYSDNLDIQKKLNPNTIINYVDIDSIDNKKFVIGEIKRRKVAELSSRARRILKKDYIVYSTVRPYLKNIAIIEKDLENFIGSTGFLVFKAFQVLNKYVFNFLLNPILNKTYEDRMVGFNSPSITNETFENTLFPLPPLEIQERIVSKLDELMQFCNQLETSVKESQKINEQLLQQVLREALQPKAKEVVLPLVAEDREEYSKTKVVELKPTNVDYYKRSVLAAELVWQLHKEPTLGHLKLQKLIYLCQKTSEMQLPTNFLRQAMGPYDNRLMRSIDKQFLEKKWFAYNKESSLKYLPLEKAGEHQKDFLKYFSNEQENIQFLIDKFRKAKSDSIEIVATLYACIERILEEKSIFSEDLLIKYFYEWSDEKKKFSEIEVKEKFAKMIKTGIIPKGFM